MQFCMYGIFYFYFFFNTSQNACGEERDMSTLNTLEYSPGIFFLPIMSPHLCSCYYTFQFTIWSALLWWMMLFQLISILLQTFPTVIQAPPSSHLDHPFSKFHLLLRHAVTEPFYSLQWGCDEHSLKKAGTVPGVPEPIYTATSGFYVIEY